MKTTITIGKLAKQANVNVETIRYYERIGMIVQPTKPFSGYRQYNKSLVNTLKFIKRAQQLGFVLSEVRELLDLGNGHCSDVKVIAQEKKIKIQMQIDDLMLMRNELEKQIDACNTTENSSHCALIDTLANRT